jgi:cation/acetate symporter
LPALISSRKLTKKIQEAPEWFKNWEEQGMIAWVDKNNDGIMQYRAGDVFQESPLMMIQPDRMVLPALSPIELPASENEVYYDKDIIVLANPEMAGSSPMGDCLGHGWMCGRRPLHGGGLLLVLSTAISHDLMKKIINPDISDQQEMKYARIASFGALVGGRLFWNQPPSSFVAKTVAFAFGLAASSFFPHPDHGNLFQEN